MSKKLVCGVGLNDLKGWCNSPDPRRRWLYHEWAGMLTRCYNPKFQKRQPTYIGCTVCDRWLTFSNFVNDTLFLPGFETVQAFGFKGVSLDKDSRVIGNKEYSPDTCCWLTKSDNVRESVMRNGASMLNPEVAHKGAVSKGRSMVAVSPDGVATEYFGTAEAERQLGISNKTIGQCCRSYFGSHTISRGPFKGWSFYWKDEYNS